jgi:hypothetical protein
MFSAKKRSRGIVVLCAFAVPVLAQIGTSNITGRVTDPTGAVVPQVGVAVVNTDTNFKFSVQTNAEGLFRVQSLQPGPYRVTFSAAGFKQLVRDNVTLLTGDTLAVDVSLEVGSATESLEVTAQAPLLETETSATGSLKTGNFLYTLPMNQRYVLSTLMLVPAVQTAFDAYGGSLTSFNVAGQRSGSIGLFEDGVLGNTQIGTSGTAIKPIQNSLQEVKILTTVLPAEYGHSAGGVVSAVKKTGTNELHGMASFFGRSRRMQERRFFDKYRTSDPQPGAPNGTPSFYMEPDANVGGPIVLPKLYNGRNKTFFFFGYQKLIEKKGLSAVGTVPTPDMLNGDFTFAGAGQSLYDPQSTRQLADGTWVRDPIPGNRIPQSRIDPVAQKIVQIHPWGFPNTPGSFTSNGPLNNFFYNSRSRTFFEEFSGRIDNQFNEKFKISGSYTYNHQSGNGRPANIQIKDFDANNGNLTPFTSQNYSVGYTWVPTNSLVNDARLGYARFRNDRFVPSYGKNYGQILGIPNIDAALMPGFGTGDQMTPDSIYGLSLATGPTRTIGETISFRDDLTKVYGKHAFKVGYDLVRFRQNAWSTGQPSGLFSFASMTAGLQTGGQPVPATGNTFAGFLLGAAQSVTFTQPLTSWLPRDLIHSFYVQDDWRVTPGLTINVGLRYSNESPYNTKYGKMSQFDPNAIDPLTGLKGAIVHPTGPLNKRDNNNLQPRMGVAWHVSNKWVIRGGLGLYTVDRKFPLASDQFDEYTATVVQQRAVNDPRPVLQLSQGAAPVQYQINPNGTSYFLGTNYSSRTAAYWDPNLHNAYVLNWNGGVQYQINPTYMLELTYQGSAGVGLIERWQYNTFPIDFASNNASLRQAVFNNSQAYRPFPQFGDILLRSNTGHSSYHSGTIKLEKRYSRGLILSSFYTFAKTLDEQDNDNAGSGVAPIQNRKLEKGRAGWDRNHVFTTSLTYELPLGKGRALLNRSGFWNVLFGGYEIAWIQTFETGYPYNFSFTNSPYNYYPTFAGVRRPDCVQPVELVPNWRNLGPDRFNSAGINPIVNINDFAYPAAFAPGSCGRNVMTGVPLIWSTASAQKKFRFKERFSLEVRLDYDNPLKTWSFSAPSTTVDFKNPQTFGKLTADGTTAEWGGQPLMDLKLTLTF